MNKHFAAYDFGHCLTASTISLAQSIPLFKNKIEISNQNTG